jgi:hypothetical protein
VPKVTTFCALIVLVAIGWVACTSGDSVPVTSPSFAVGGTEKCKDTKSFAAKDEVGPPWSITAPAGKVIAEVCVKAGPKVYLTSSNTTISVNGTPCFDVTGIGTRTVTVTNNPGRIGNICKGISHIQVNFGPRPSPTPQPSPSPSPTPTPTPTPTPY